MATALSEEIAAWHVWLLDDPEEWLELSAWPKRIGRRTLFKKGCDSLDCVIAADRYGRTPVLSTAIHLFKYKRILPYAEPLAALLKRAAGVLPLEKGTVLCPVPLHWSRQWFRGFNQSEELARVLAPTFECRVENFLRRAHRTGFQSHRKTKGERIDAMQNAFTLLPQTEALPTHVVLVDDIFTTGSTLNACARVLKQAGVQRVDALVVAHR